MPQNTVNASQDEISCESSNSLEISGMLLRPLALLSFVLLFVGCSTPPKYPYIDCSSEFSRIVSTDFEGKIVSVWIGAGKVSYDSSDRSYNFLAVEKTRHSRFPVNRRYVVGRPVKVVAPNVDVYPIEPPSWICWDNGATGYAK